MGNNMKMVASTRLIFLTLVLTYSWLNVVSSSTPDEENYQQPNLGKPERFDSEEHDPSLSANVLIKREANDNDDVASSSPPNEQNVTEVPPESPSASPASASTSSSTPSTTPPTTPTPSPPPPTTTEEPFTIPEGEATRKYFCLCDHHVRSCDMNCCCDTDCSDEEKKLFTGCTGSVIYDPKNHQNKDHSCMKSYIMYRQNVPYRIDRADKSLFCIVKENVKQGREFSQKDMARIKNRISHGKINSKPKYGWDQVHHMKDFQMKSTPYKYGSPIWTMKLVEGEDPENFEETMLRLPAPYHTDSCSLNEPVKFLVDSNSSCVLPVAPLERQCETLRALNVNNLVKKYSIIVSPEKMEENTTNYLVRTMFPDEICYNDWNHCNGSAHESLSPESSDFPEDAEDIELPTPLLSNNKRICQNILSHLKLTFIHEGINGITKIIAKMLLVDVPTNVKEIRQHFFVDFIWGSEHKSGSKSKAEGAKGDDNNQTISMEDILAIRKLPRSGNPGYIVGKPVILGRKVATSANPPNRTTTLEKIHVLPDPSQWLGIHQAGNCPVEEDQIKDFPKYPVSFGYDHVSSCRLPLEPFRYCEQVQRHIASILLGVTGEDPQQIIKFPPTLFVAAYGSPDAFPSDWVPLTFVEMSSLLFGSSSAFPSSAFASNNLISGGCDITTSVHITIAYAYVGPVDAPQAKITGVFYEPEESIHIPPDTEENQGKVRDLAVTTTVSFVDVSGKPTTRVATWPVLSIQLPSDFFYPFSSSSSGALPSGRGGIGGNELFPGSRFIIMFAGVFLLM